MLGFLLAAVVLGPGAQPQVAVSGGVVAVAYGSANSVYFAESRDGGRTFSKPVAVESPGKLMLGRHRGPRIAVIPGAIVVSAVVDGDLLAWRSADGGRSWSRAARINDVPAAAREGLHAMAGSPAGLLYAAWLDLRNQRTQIWGASSSDGGAAWSGNRLIYESPDGHTCECCHPTVAIDGSTVFVMWRNWLNGARDMYFTRSADGGRTFAQAQKLGGRTWPLNACPMDGGGLALENGHPVAVWRRESAIYTGRPGALESKLGNGKDPAIAVTPRGRYIGWTEGQGIDLLAPGAESPRRLADRGGYLSLAPGYAAYEAEGKVVVERLE